VEQEEEVIMWQWSNKHISATTEELLEVVFSVWSMLRLCSENQREKLVSQRLESVVSSHKLHVSSDSWWLAMRILYC
jgi:hypothetical protein